MLTEVELGGLVSDLPKLRDTVTVLGNVKSTPRYGTKSEAWVGGAWQEIGADTTLADRFIIRTNLETAKSLSAQNWVEWVAPAKAGTQYDTKTISFWQAIPLKVKLGLGGGAVIGGVAGFKYPKGAYLSRLDRALPLLAAGLGAVIGGAAGVLAPELKLKLPELPLTGEGRCPVCGMMLPEKPLGVDVKCPSCGFVSAYTR